jgi:hypothetical protein
MCGRSKSKALLIHVTLNMDTRVLMSVETESRRINIISIYHNLSTDAGRFCHLKNKSIRSPCGRPVFVSEKASEYSYRIKPIRSLSVKMKERVFDVCCLQKAFMQAYMAVSRRSSRLL